MKKFIAAALILSASLYACKTDFDVIAPYREVMVIDGLLDATDSVQTVSVTKAFLGEGNALVMAQQSDSLNYADVLDVQLEKVSGGQDSVFIMTRRN